ncbi:hypothetical protein [Streptomyces sp. Y7]|uniref:hypothetical protein n=1 Tax=Streptomyces sp. Y7 TaxID=3342392 RepID=UPI003710507B
MWPDLPITTVLRLVFRHHGPLNELINGHELQRCCCHGVDKADVPHSLNAIAVNIERRSTKRDDLGF